MIEPIHEPRRAGSESPATKRHLARITAHGREATNPSARIGAKPEQPLGGGFWWGCGCAPATLGVVGALGGVLSGGVLLSHTLACAVPSALGGLTSGFGMGPGVSLSL